MHKKWENLVVNFPTPYYSRLSFRRIYHIEDFEIVASIYKGLFQIVNMGGFGSKLWGSALHIPVMVALQLVFIVLFGLFTRLSMPS